MDFPLEDGGEQKARENVRGANPAGEDQADVKEDGMLREEQEKGGEDSGGGGEGHGLGDGGVGGEILPFPMCQEDTVVNGQPQQEHSGDGDHEGDGPAAQSQEACGPEKRGQYRQSGEDGVAERVQKEQSEETDDNTGGDGQPGQLMTEVLDERVTEGIGCDERGVGTGAVQDFLDSFGGGWEENGDVVVSELPVGGA